MENNYYIYLHIRLDNGQPFYVGKGKNNRAFVKNGRNSYWNNIVNKYDYDIIILEDNLNEIDSYKLEKYWVKRIGRENLSNLSDAGKGGISNPSKELREKMRKNNLGKKQSEETRKKRSENGKGKGGKKIIIDGITYNTITEAANKLNITLTMLHYRIKSSNGNYSHSNWVNKTHTKEWIDKISKNLPNSEKLKGNKYQKKVKVLNIETNEIYDSITEAANLLGYNRGWLWKNLKYNKENKTNLRIV
jgi:hypothetical protein